MTGDENCTKIYISDADRRHYEDLGVEIHTGPQGGTFICEEDLQGKIKHSGVSGSLKSPENLVNDLRAAGFSGAKLVKTGDGFSIVVNDDVRIDFSRDKITLHDWKFSWSVEGDAKSLIAGYLVVRRAIENIKKRDYKFVENSFGPFEDFAARKSMDSLLTQSIVFESLEVSSQLVKDVVKWDFKSSDDVKMAMEYVFGPWVGKNVFDVVDGVELSEGFKAVLHDERFWRSLIQMVGVSASKDGIGGVKFVFEDVGKTSDVAGDGTFAYYLDSEREIHIPVNNENNFHVLRSLWHEFGHYIDFSFYVSDFHDYLMDFVWMLALRGKLSDYAKTNEREAFAEMIGFSVVDRDEIDADDFDIRRFYESLFDAMEDEFL